MGNVKGMPIGLSFMGPKWSDALILSLGYAFEQASQKRLDPRFVRSIEETPEVARHFEPAQ
jgi:amidase